MGASPYPNSDIFPTSQAGCSPLPRVTVGERRFENGRQLRAEVQQIYTPVANESTVISSDTAGCIAADCAEQWRDRFDTDRACH